LSRVVCDGHGDSPLNSVGRTYLSAHNAL
jgi:hypothetical protein